MQYLAWLEQTWISVQIREYVWGQPILVALHMIGLTGSVGTLVWFDLRLLGVGIRNCPVSRFYRMVKPWMLASFAVMMASGALMFMAYATLAVADIFFWTKMAALSVAGVNALTYHLVIKRGIAGWDNATLPPLPARIAGLISIIAWVVVIISGRMMAYTMYGLDS